MALSRVLEGFREGSAERRSYLRKSLSFLFASRKLTCGQSFLFTCLKLPAPWCQKAKQLVASLWLSGTPSFAL